MQLHLSESSRENSSSSSSDHIVVIKSQSSDEDSKSNKSEDETKLCAVSTDVCSPFSVHIMHADLYICFLINIRLISL